MKTAYNKRFGASGGVARPNFCGYFHLLWLVATFVKPPPAVKPPGRKKLPAYNKARPVNPKEQEGKKHD
jgi:hypothetical protein